MSKASVEAVSRRVFIATVPVQFMVTVDDAGQVIRVEQTTTETSRARAWIRHGHNAFGTAYGKAPTGLLAKAARLVTQALNETKTG